MHRTVLALLWLVAFPASAPAGYDVAHTLERTCEPGGRLTVDRRTLCEAPRLHARDGSGRRIAERAVPATTALLSTADHVPHARSLDGELCAPAWLTETYAMLRSLLRRLI